MTKEITLRERRCAPLQLCVVVAVAVCAATAAEKVVWRPLEQAILKMDDRPARLWNVYRAEKKDHLLLVQLGRRFLMIDYRERQIYELEPEKLEHKDKELIWNAADKPSKPMATADWLVHDAGRVRRIRAKLSDEGRVLEVQVPIQPDLRGLY